LDMLVVLVVIAGRHLQGFVAVNTLCSGKVYSGLYRGVMAKLPASFRGKSCKTWRIRIEIYQRMQTRLLKQFLRK